MGAAALPVYEIYKAGQELHWLDGLNLFSAVDMKLAIVPHWNNAEGGNYDTRYCYMGAGRFLELEKQLGSEIAVLGIDEHTACIFDLPAQECLVMGAGTVTIRCDGSECSHLKKIAPIDPIAAHVMLLPRRQSAYSTAKAWAALAQHFLTRFRWR
jgi:hypothetical protein